MRNRFFIFPILIGVLLCGCGGKFECKGTMGGVHCETLSSVYEREVEGTNKQVVANPKEKKSKKGKEEVQLPTHDESVDAIRALNYNDSKPLRIPPKVIRIWVAPWEDADGDAQQPGYIYSEITDKRGRWVFNEKEVVGIVPSLSPLNAINEKDSTAQPVNITTDKASKTPDKNKTAPPARKPAAVKKDTSD